MSRNLPVAVLVIIVLAGFAAPASAQKVYIDYSPLAHFGSYKSFAWFDTPQASIYDHNPLNHSRIKHAVEYYLIQGGMTEDTENPDLHVTYHGSSSEDFEININYFDYGYATDWEWDSYWGNVAGTTTTTSTVYKSGTLVIDIWEVDTKKLIWRGTMEGTITDDLRKGAKKLDKGIAKMVKKWRKMREEAAR